MTQPLAVLLYERLLPGSQLVNRLQDLGYRVHQAPSPSALVETCIQEKPILVLADVREQDAAVKVALRALSTDSQTQHLPVIGIVPSKSLQTAEELRTLGVKLVVHDSVILAHLDQFIDQALQLD